MSVLRSVIRVVETNSFFLSYIILNHVQRYSNSYLKSISFIITNSTYILSPSFYLTTAKGSSSITKPNYKDF